jgi:hypothetical protein
MSAIPDHPSCLPEEVIRRQIGAPRRCPEPLPPAAAGPASGADQRITPGLVMHVGQPGLAQGLNGGVWNHRGLLGTVDLVAARDVQPSAPGQAPSRTSTYDRA